MVLKKVELIASGYEFVCPECGAISKTKSVKLTVECEKCGCQFKISDYNHALG